MAGINAVSTMAADLFRIQLSIELKTSKQEYMVEKYIEMELFLSVLSS